MTPRNGRSPAAKPASAAALFFAAQRAHANDYCTVMRSRAHVARLLKGLDLQFVASHGQNALLAFPYVTFLELMLTLLYTGMRCADGIALTRDNVVFKQGGLILQPGIIGATGTASAGATSASTSARKRQPRPSRSSLRARHHGRPGDRHGQAPRGRGRQAGHGGAGQRVPDQAARRGLRRGHGEAALDAQLPQRPPTACRSPRSCASAAGRRRRAPSTTRTTPPTHSRSTAALSELLEPHHRSPGARWTSMRSRSSPCPSTTTPARLRVYAPAGRSPIVTRSVAGA